MLRATFFLLGFAALAGGQSIDASLRYLGQTPRSRCAQEDVARPATVPSTLIADPATR
jgi:hypothetical protein